MKLKKKNIKVYQRKKYKGTKAEGKGLRGVTKAKGAN